MSFQRVNIGSAPNASGADSLRGGFIKVNSNFQEIYGTGSAPWQVWGTTVQSGTSTAASWIPLQSQHLSQASIDGLSDVVISSLSGTTEWLVYTGSNWVNQIAAVSNLFDVTITNAVSGQYLTYDSVTSQKWINTTVVADTGYRIISTSTNLYATTIHIPLTANTVLNYNRIEILLDGVSNSVVGSLVVRAKVALTTNVTASSAYRTLSTGFTGAGFDTRQSASATSMFVGGDTGGGWQMLAASSQCTVKLTLTGTSKASDAPDFLGAFMMEGEANYIGTSGLPLLVRSYGTLNSTTVSGIYLYTMGTMGTLFAQRVTVIGYRS